MCFPSPFKNDFWAPLNCFRMPASRRIEFFGSFLAPPWILRGPQNRPKSPKWRQNGRKERTPVLPGGAPGANLFPGSILGAIFDAFWMIFDGFLMIFWPIFLHFYQNLAKKTCKYLVKKRQPKCNQHVLSANSRGRRCCGLWPHSIE